MAEYARGDYECGEYARIELDWIFRTDAIVQEYDRREPHATIRVDEPHRETYGHSGPITVSEARGMIAALQDFVRQSEAFMHAHGITENSTQ